MTDEREREERADPDGTRSAIVEPDVARAAQLGEAETLGLMDEAGAGMPPEGLGRTAVGGVAWEGLSFILGKLMTLAATIVLARILIPEEFGLVALALVFITYAEAVTDLGVARSLVYLPSDPARTQAALVLALGWGGLLVVATVLVAPSIARLFEQPEIVPMIRVLSISLLLGGVGEIPDSLLRKSMRFRQRLIASFVRALVRGIASIVLAVSGAGAWAIILGHVIGYAAWNLVAWPLSGVRFRRSAWRLDRSLIRPMLAYGIPVAGNSLLLALIFNIDYLIIGKRLGPEALGFYTLAFRIPELIILQALWVFGAVAFPMYSLLKGDPVRLRRGYLTAVRLQSAYGMAIGAGLAIGAALIVPVVFGPRWAGSIVALQALGLYGAFRALGTGITELSNGLGRPRVNVVLSLVWLAVLVPTLWIASPHGLAVVAWAHAAVALAMGLMKQGVAFRLLRLGASTFFGRLLIPTLAAGVGAAGAVLLVRLALPGTGSFQLVLGTLAGGVGAIGVLWVVDRDLILEVRGLLSRRRSASIARS